MATTDGGEAFPRPASQMVDGGLESEPQPGMSLRDFMAAHALTLAGAVALDRGKTAIDVELTAKTAYKIADAMLAQRAAGGPAGEG
jgi:hypothetical protein